MKVERGQVLADGPCTRQGELALGRNILVAFMPWVTITKTRIRVWSVVMYDFFTSIISRSSTSRCGTRSLAPSDHATFVNVCRRAQKDLDESGDYRIARRQAGRHPGRKVTPKGETEATLEKSRAIFGKRRRCPRCLSSAGIEGVIVDVNLLRKGTEKDLWALSIEQDDGKIEKNSRRRDRIIREEANKKIADLRVGKVSTEEMND